MEDETARHLSARIAVPRCQLWPPAAPPIKPEKPQAGFVNRLRCEKDRRVIYVALTDQGAKTLADLDEPLLALHRKLTGHLSQGDLKDLIRLLEKVRERWAGVDE